MNLETHEYDPSLNANSQKVITNQMIVTIVGHCEGVRKKWKKLKGTDDVDFETISISIPISKSTPISISKSKSKSFRNRCRYRHRNRNRNRFEIDVDIDVKQYFDLSHR